MSTTVCLSADTLYYPEGGGHFWVYLNWALGLRAAGCRVLWLEEVRSVQRVPASCTRARSKILKSRLQRFGLEEPPILWSRAGNVPAEILEDNLPVDAATDADLLLNQRYACGPELPRRFRRSALLDIDPGLLQVWLSSGSLQIPRHDIYFTIGETVGRPGSLFPDGGLDWHYTPPCVALDWWPVLPPVMTGLFTTVSNWTSNEWMEDAAGPYRNDKCSGFLPFLDLPRHTKQPLELALALGIDEESERLKLRERGWQVRDAASATSTPGDYQRYIQNSRGEFDCAKPSCVRLQNAWISDRTLCYLASGKPAVEQHTGSSRFLPDAAGLFRFRDPEEAAQYLEYVAADYERQGRLARALAEEFFDARKIVRRLLERALS